MFSEISKNGLVYMAAPNIPFSHGFTTRYGGVSRGAFESLDLGENRGDEPERVRENFRRVKAALGIDKLCFTHQIHENKVRYVTGADAREPGDDTPPDCDGLVTDEEGLALIIFIADCAPILLCDPERHVIAAAHAGWRGTVARCCFETGPEVPEAVTAVLGKEGREYIDGSERDGGKFFVDLKGVNRALLIRAGLRPENICVSDECTVCESDKYWSHRVTGGLRGSQAAIIVNRRA